MPQTTNARKLIFIRKFTVSRKTICFHCKTNLMREISYFLIKWTSLWSYKKNGGFYDKISTIFEYSDKSCNFDLIYLKSSFKWFCFKIKIHTSFQKQFNPNTCRNFIGWGVCLCGYNAIHLMEWCLDPFGMYVTDVNDLLICWRSEIYQVNLPRRLNSFDPTV